jgi:uncharacterized iron-regulated protein
MIPSPHRRVLQLQRRILQTIRSEVRRVLGRQPAALRRYYEAYKREFRGEFELSSKEDLLRACRESDVILVGDYHTFGQSQKAALKLLEELVEWYGEGSAPIALGLEMVPSEHQAALGEFMSGNISEADYLASTRYDATWGFSWDSFRRFLHFAKDHKLPVLALNDPNGTLEQRDAHAADLIANFRATHPSYKLFTVFGDLHLSRTHLPQQLRRHLKELETKARVLTVFQNSEQVYWRLAQRGLAEKGNVVRLHERRYCIMNAAPWVKLQSYLEWAESSELFDIEEGAGPQMHEIAQDNVKNLAVALDLPVPENLDFTVQSAQTLGFFANGGAISGMPRPQKKLLQAHVLGARTFFLPQAHLLYVPSPSVNTLCEGSALVLFAALSSQELLYDDPSRQFHAAALTAAIAYFGSKILNPRRKCDLEDDWRIADEAKLSSRALPRQRLMKRVARLTLSHLNANRTFLRGQPYRLPRIPRGPSRTSLFLETSRAVGEILGEKLYAAFLGRALPITEVQNLFREPHGEPRIAREKYLELVRKMEQAPLTHTSKEDLF